MVKIYFKDFSIYRLRSILILCGLFASPVISSAQQFLNGSFSNAQSNWITTGSFHCINSGFSDYNSAPGYAYFAATDGQLGDSNNITGTLTQSVDMPASYSSASVQFYTKITTQEVTTSTGYDIMNCTVTDGSNPNNFSQIKLSNLNASSGYVLHTIPIPTSMAGHNVTLTFYAANDGAKGTVFRVDDVFLNLVGAQSLASPAFLSPTNNSIQVVGNNINFSWSSVTGASSYDYEFDAGTSYAYQNSTNNTSLSWPAVVGGIGSHTLHIRAKNGGNIGLWSATLNYSVSLGTPSLTAPENGGDELVGGIITFGWTDVTAATSYDFEFDAGTSYELTKSTFFATLIWPASLDAIGTHTWHVRAVNGTNKGPWSTTFMYTLGALDIPKLLTPISGSIQYTGNDIEFSWTSILGANGYDFEFDTGTAYAYTQSTHTSSLNWEASTSGIGTHTWRVRAKHDDVVGQWSSVQTYEVAKPVITTIYPRGGENFIIGTYQDIKWTSTGLTGNVKIEINGQYPSNPWETIAQNIPNTGVFPWLISGAVGNAKRIRITSLNDPTISSISTDNFSMDNQLSRPGVTILAHGYDSGDDNPISYWTEDFIIDLLKASGGGRVSIYQPADGSLQEIRNLPLQAAQKLYNDLTTQKLYRIDGETILLMDWLVPSSSNRSGEAEAAADALFASLVSPDGSGEPISTYIDLSNPATSKPLHLIGHSRGTAVISELAQRLGKYGIKVNYATYLDPHDYNEADVPLDENFHDPAVQVWNNITYADNYWQLSSWPIVPSGRKLSPLSDGYSNNQYELTALNHFGNSIAPIPGISTNSHTQVKIWYSGTIVPGSQETDWYIDATGAGAGMSRWLSLGGYNYNGNNNGITNPADPVLAGKGSYNPSANIVPYPNVNDGDQDFAPLNFFMGDFSLKDLTIPDYAGLPIAGWYYHGGGGAGFQNSAGDLVLNHNGSKKTHNRFVISPMATKLNYQYKINSSSSADKLTISIGTNVAKQIDLSRANGWIQDEIDLTNYRGKVRTVSFEITSPNSISSEVWITNISIDEQTPAVCVTPIAPTLLYGADNCSAPSVVTGTQTALLNFSSNGGTAFKAQVSKYPYGTNNIVFDPTCQTSTTAFQATGLVRGMLYRWNMYAYGATDCVSCRSALSKTKYFSLPPEITSNGTQLTSGNSITLSTMPQTPGEGATVNYRWLKDGTLYQQGSNLTSINATVAGVYTLIIDYSGSGDCSGTTSTDLSNALTLTSNSDCTPSVAPTVIYQLTSNTNSGPQTQLTVAGGSLGKNALWKWYSGSCGGTLISSGTSNTITVTPTATTDYYVRAESDCNTTDCASTTVSYCTFSTAPAALVASANNIAPGTPITLTVNGGFLGTNASWLLFSGSCGGTVAGSGRGSVFNVSPNVTTTYYIEAVGSCNTTECTSVTVNVNDKRPIVTSFSPTVAKAGTTITIIGENLDNASSVSFGGYPARSFTQVSSTTITAVVDVGPSGGATSIFIQTPIGLATAQGFTYATFDFDPLPSKIYGAADFPLGAFGPSEISYRSTNSSVATIVSNNIHIIGAGTTTILATDGNSTLFHFLTVSPASLTITANNLSKTYGTANPPLTVSYSGFVNGDTPSVLTGLPTVTTTATAASVEGKYPITVSGASAANYIFQYKPGLLTVTLSSNAILTTLALTPKTTLTVASGPGYKNYTATVPGTVSSIQITPTAQDTAARITMNGQTVVSGTSSQAIPLILGVNTITISVTAQDGVTTKTYTLTLTRQPSTDATLSTLTYTPAITKTPVTGPDYKDYVAKVANAFTSIAVIPVVHDPAASVKVNGVPVASGATSAQIPLNVGPNIINTVITAQDGVTTKTYKLTVTRLSNNAELTLLKLSPVSALTQVSGTDYKDYTAAAPNNETSVKVLVTTQDTAARVKVNGAAVASGGSSDAIPLNVGNNLVTTTVTAQDGTIKNYKITLTRAASADATLATLTYTPAITKTPVTGDDYKDYIATVPATYKSIAVIPVVHEPNAKVKVNGKAVASGATSAQIALAIGQNVISTVITAQDGITTKTYKLTVTRLASVNATLAAIKLSPVSALTTVTGPDYKDYTATAPYNQTSVKVIPTAQDTTAVISVNGMIVKSGATSAAIPLNAGANVITTVVTAQDGVTVKTYKITITRAPSTDATLATLNFTPAISKTTVTGSDYRDYTATVANSFTSIAVIPTVHEAHATVTVNGMAVASGDTSAPVSLNVGANIINTVVTAQDGISTDTYSLTITRKPASANMAYQLQEQPIAANNIIVHQSLSPNGDGNSDVLLIDGITAYPENKLQIINRGGELVYQVKGYDNRSRVFDGQSNINGKLQPAGTYFYSLDYKDGNETKHKTGFIVLKY